VRFLQYHYWGKQDPENFVATAVQMYKQGGFKLFFAGTQATVCRDLVFGAVYAVLRHSGRLHDKLNRDGTVNSLSKFWHNMVAAFAATIVSSPLNYVRNIHYAMPPDQYAGSSLQILRELWHDTNVIKVPLNPVPRPTAFNFRVVSVVLQSPILYRLIFLQRRLRIGWGTTRVAVGMAFASQVYEKCVTLSGADLTT
jgi:hypothetical protein